MNETEPTAAEFKAQLLLQNLKNRESAARILGIGRGGWKYSFAFNLQILLYNAIFLYSLYMAIFHKGNEPFFMLAGVFLYFAFMAVERRSTQRMKALLELFPPEKSQ
jgi:hypothetical protein